MSELACSVSWCRRTFVDPYALRNHELSHPPAQGDVYFRLGIFARDNWTCRYCGYVWPEVARRHPMPWRALGVRRITLDHVIPRSRGGKTSQENLVAACAECNRKRAAVGPELDALCRALSDLVADANPPSDMFDEDVVNLVCRVREIRAAHAALKAVAK